MNDDYTLRGTCREASERAVANDPTLTLVRGFYWCPMWNVNEQHWWTKRADGTIYDPTAKQFPSAGLGEYVEYDGTVQCEQCGETIPEDKACFDGRHAFCSYRCHGLCIGVL